jgi:adenylate cyclase class 2
MSKKAEESLERELKFSLPEQEALRERLLELEAERVNPSSFEDNWVLDRGGELEASHRLLRLRKDGQGALLTLKGPATFEDGVKIRQENETPVENLEELRTILEILGYTTVRRYQKVREEWHLGGVTIALDHTPIGDFVEFEGSGAETVAKRCGFRVADAETRTYLGIYDERRDQDPSLPRDMTFP